MGGTINDLIQTTTSGGTLMDHQLYRYWPYQTTPTYYYSTITPVECAGDTHVFPCPHCDKCKCGKATVRRKPAKGEK
jgi:hypothetical protein